MTYFGQFPDDPYYMTAEEEAREIEKQKELDAPLTLAQQAEAQRKIINAAGQGLEAVTPQSGAFLESIRAHPALAAPELVDVLEALSEIEDCWRSSAHEHKDYLSHKAALDAINLAFDLVKAAMPRKD